MASWSEVEAQVPELATLARGLLDAFTHKTLATLRRDGAPRISDPDRIREVNGAAEGRSHLFRADVGELVVVRLNETTDGLVSNPGTPGAASSASSDDSPGLP